MIVGPFGFEVWACGDVANGQRPSLPLVGMAFEPPVHHILKT
jgi:hypothetical protein